jgi:NADPH:quinone reductase
MKAIRVYEFGGPEVIRFEELPDPEPRDGQILVRVAAAGVNPVDVYMRAGTYPRKPQLPYTPGIDGAGVVEALGPGAHGVAVGDRVYIAGPNSGTYAELASCDKSIVHPLPASASYSQGAAVGVPYATAYRALFQRARALSGESVLVHGASGGVGTAAVQLARAAGMTVFGTASTDRGRKLIADHGAHHVLDHHAENYLQEIMDLTDLRGLDVILEMLANVNLGKDLGLLAQNGRVVVIGSRGSVEIDARNAMVRDGDVLTMSIWNTSPRDLSSIHAALVAGLENRTLRPVIGKEFPLKDAQQAHRAVMESGAHGKIVLIPG